MRDQVPKELDIVFLKVQGAFELYSGLQYSIDDFISNNPYSLILEEEIERFQYRAVVQRNHVFPAMNIVIVGEILHDLRSALDNLACALVVQRGYGCGDSVGFPIARTRNKLSATIKRKIKKAHPDAIETIKSLKPYHRGNDLLWCLHRLNIHDKHRLSIVSSPILNQFWYPEMSKRDRNNCLRIEARGIIDHPLENGRRIYTIRAKKGFFHDQISVNSNLPIEMVFFDPPIVRGKPVLNTLDQLVKETQKIIRLFIRFFPRPPLSQTT